MENLFSFRYIKLGASLVFLLTSALASQQYISLPIGGIFLMTAFASFASYSYRGVKSKTSYIIARYMLATLLLIISGIQIYVAITMPYKVHYSLYYTIIDVALISYLVMFKPSASSIAQKALKSVGYTLILIGVLSLQSAKSTIYTAFYTTSAVNWGIVLAIILMFVIGIALLVISSKQTDKQAK